jgi:hypothetical protein
MIRNLLTGTEPIHLHANGNRGGEGWIRRLYDGIRAAQQTPAASRRPCPIEVVTVSNAPRGSTHIEHSCAFWGVPLVVLRPKQQWTTNCLKTALAIKHLQSTSAEVLLLSDAFDAVFVRHPSELLDRLQGGALMSGERNDHPKNCPVPAYDGLYPFGNSGGIAGERKVLLKWFKRAYSIKSEQYAKSNQWGMRIAAHELGIPVDTNASMFQTLFLVEPGEVERIA